MIEAGYDGYQVAVLRTDMALLDLMVNDMTLIILHRFVDEYAIQIDGDDDHLHEEGFESSILFELGVQVLAQLVGLVVTLQLE